MEEHQCCTQIWEPGSFRYHPCTRKGTVEEYGKWFCWQHDSKRVARLEQEAYDKRERARKENRDAEWRRRLEQSACYGITNTELSGLGVTGLRKLLDGLKE